METKKFRFKKSWRVRTLKALLLIQTLNGAYLISTGTFTTMSLMAFVLVAFFTFSVFIQSPSFEKLSGYYAILLGVYFTYSLLGLGKSVGAGSMVGIVGTILDATVTLALIYLLCDKKNLIEHEEVLQDGNPERIRPQTNSES